eukprot:1157116-Pelagomonas_calceolata.AAC.3
MALECRFDVYFLLDWCPAQQGNLGSPCMVTQRQNTQHSIQQQTVRARVRACMCACVCVRARVCDNDNELGMQKLQEATA